MTKKKNKMPVNNHQEEIQITRRELMAAAYSGPIPPAEQLKQYEEICEGAADRILAMAETQSLHRQSIESSVIKSNTRNSLLGIIFAFILGLSTIWGGVFLAYNGLPWPGALLGSAGLIGLVSVFIYGTRSNREERNSKRKSE